LFGEIGVPYARVLLQRAQYAFVLLVQRKGVGHSGREVLSENGRKIETFFREEAEYAEIYNKNFGDVQIK